MNATTSPSQETSPPARPNILLIMDDQHRFDWLGSAGANWVKTPNIDALATRGVRFSTCCTTSPVCVPARIGLATGLLPFRTGMLDNGGYLAPGLPTYYQRLRDHGYRVGCVGKLHMDQGDPQSPKGDGPRCYQWGFTHPEEHQGKAGAGLNKAGHDIYAHFLKEKGQFEAFHADYLERHKQKAALPFCSHDSVLPKELYHDYWIGTRSVEWIRNISDDRPWHLFVSFGGPHDPFDPPKEFGDRYRNANIPPPVQDNMDGKPAWIQGIRQMYDEKSTPEKVAASRRQYAACIEVVDDRVGAIMKALEDRGMLENTVVIFTSDHGEMAGDHGLWRKRVMYEASLRVPLIAAGPGVTAGGLSDALVELSDINPTICELAGLPPQPRIDARSFAGLLSDPKKAHRDFICSFHSGDHACVRTKNLKFIRNTGKESDLLLLDFALLIKTPKMSNDPTQVSEMYDLAADPNELRNLADDPRAAELEELLRERLVNFS